MIKTRIIPILLHRQHQLVKGEGFDSTRPVGHALQAAKIHQSRDVDELLVLDVSGNPSGPDHQFVRELTADCFMPLAYGGGIFTEQQISQLFKSGADKIVIRSAKHLIRPASRKYGSQSIAVSVTFDGHGDPIAEALQAQNLGAGEIVLTSVPRDGTLSGYDIPVIRAVCQAVAIPVVAAGGCRSYADMADALNAGAHAVAAGALFQFTDATPQGAARYLKSKGFAVR